MLNIKDDKNDRIKISKTKKHIMQMEKKEQMYDSFRVKKNKTNDSDKRFWHWPSNV